jgi:hypothetical protein
MTENVQSLNQFIPSHVVLNKYTRQTEQVAFGGRKRKSYREG